MLPSLRLIVYFPDSNSIQGQAGIGWVAAGFFYKTIFLHTKHQAKSVVI